MTKRYPSDGFTRPTTTEDIKVGNVVRMVNPDGSQAVFSDCVISFIEGDVITLLRPMVWSNGNSYTERFSAYSSRLMAKDFRTVLAANGEPYTMLGGPIDETLEANRQDLTK